MRGLTIAAVLAAGVAAAPPAWATTFVGTYEVSYNATDPGLVVHVAPAVGNISFDLTNAGDSTGWFPLFRIWTDETTVNPDDEVAKPISVTYSFSAPPPAFGGSIPGDTVGSSLFGILQWGSVSWLDPIELTFGNGGVLAAFLSNEIFDKSVFGLGGHGATVNAKFKLLQEPSPVPLPGAFVLLAGGLGLIGLFARRRPDSPTA